MKTRNKALLLVLCAATLVVGSVFGTMAYLTSTDKVENTFTVGSVKLELDETDVNVDGTANLPNIRDTENKYHLVPGHTYIKDPTVTVVQNSEDAYVRMVVTVENFEQLKKALPQKDAQGNVIETNSKYYGEDGTFLLQMLCLDKDGNCTWDSENWTYVQSKENAAKGIYEFRYNGNSENKNGIVTKNTKGNTTLEALFKSITVPGELDNDGLAYWGGSNGEGVMLANKAVKITVVANAIQADGFETADKAWNAFDAQNN